MFSIVLASIRGIEELKPLFVTSSENAEIIIVSGSYSEETKKKIQELEHSYYKVTYAPPRSEEDMGVIPPATHIGYNRDQVRNLNTGMAMAENKWVMRTNDCIEFKPDFFDRASEDINIFYDQFKDRLIIRPVGLGSWLYKKWEKPQYLAGINKRWIDAGLRGIFNSGYFQTLDHAIFPIEIMNELNGIDERYDMAHGWDDNDLHLRANVLGCKVIVDQALMMYNYTHQVKVNPMDVNKILFDLTKIEILHGRYRAYNSFSFPDLRREMLAEKEKYVIKDDEKT